MKAPLVGDGTMTPRVFDHGVETPSKVCNLQHQTNRLICRREFVTA
jgi:hypothetical protein